MIWRRVCHVLAVLLYVGQRPARGPARALSSEPTAGATAGARSAERQAIADRRSVSVVERTSRGTASSPSAAVAPANRAQPVLA